MLDGESHFFLEVDFDLETSQLLALKLFADVEEANEFAKRFVLLHWLAVIYCRSDSNSRREEFLKLRNDITSLMTFLNLLLRWVKVHKPFKPETLKCEILQTHRYLCQPIRLYMQMLQTLHRP